MMQVCTTVCAKTAPIASGKPLSPSTTAIRTSLTPRVLSSFITFNQNLAPSVLRDPQPEHLLLAFDIEVEGDRDRFVAHQAPVVDLDPQRVEEDDWIHW